MFLENHCYPEQWQKLVRNSRSSTTKENRICAHQVSNTAETMFETRHTQSVFSRKYTVLQVRHTHTIEQL